MTHSSLLPLSHVLSEAHGPQSCGCRFCGGKLQLVVDLGKSPLCESFLAADQLNQMERFYPLTVKVCETCFLMQLDSYVDREEIFSEYAYFSSYSDSYVNHAKEYVDHVISRLGLNQSSKVVELASNDGYLLRHFEAKKIPVLGIEPAANVARVAQDLGVPTLVQFFGLSLADSLDPVDLLIANNVLAQVPDLNDFVGGMRVALAPNGVITVEVPHLAHLINKVQFDTIYHEHFSYFSAHNLRDIFAAHGLRLFDLQEIWTHGGSLRAWFCHEGANHAETPNVSRIIAEEKQLGLNSLDGFKRFAKAVEQAKWDLQEFLIKAKRQGKSVVAYGAPGKGNTLLNYCAIRTDLLDYAVDRNPYKHGRFTPGTMIPIYDVGKIKETKPDYVLILPWNLKDEIIESHGYIAQWGGQFMTPVPAVVVPHTVQKG